MELRDIIAMLRVHWVGIVMLTLAGLAAAAFASVTAVPEYRAQNSVLVSVVTGESISDLNQGSTFASRQVKTYAEVARSPKVLEPVVQQLGLRTSARGLRADVTTVVKGDVQIIEITVTRARAREAAAIADAIAAELSNAVETLSPERADGSPSVVINSISPAVVPSQPSSPDIARNLATGLVLGLVIGIGWAALRTTLDTKVRSEADVRAILESPILATVSFDAGAAAKTPTIIAEPLSIRAEEYRQLRTNLQYVNAAQRPRSFVITSSRGGEGKSVTSLNLAVALAESGVKVCLVDADLRRPSLARYLGLEGAAGLTTILIGRATVDDVLQPVGSDGLVVLTSGRTPPNPSELLGSEPMVELIASLEARFDVVIFDCAPLLPVTDAAILGTATDGVLLVAGGGIVTREQLAESAAKLSTIDVRTLGVVVNRARRAGGGDRAYGYHSHAVDFSDWSDAAIEDPSPSTPLDAVDESAQGLVGSSAHPEPPASAEQAGAAEAVDTYKDDGLPLFVTTHGSTTPSDRAVTLKRPSKHPGGGRRFRPRTLRATRATEKAPSDDLIVGLDQDEQP